MQYKDKIFLVFYVDIRNVERVDCCNYLNQMNETLTHAYDESVETIIVPTQGEPHVECINPVYIQDQNKIDELQKLLEQAKVLLNQ